MAVDKQFRRRTGVAFHGIFFAASAALAPHLSLAQEAKPAVPPAATPAAVAAEPAPAAVKVADEPKAVDSATLVDPKLRQPATIQFQETSLADVLVWLQKQTGLNVTLDARSLESVGIDSNSPITDRLDNAPVHQLLDRLQRHKIGWTLQGGVLQLHAFDDHVVLYNTQYNVGDLLDLKFDGEDLQSTLQHGITCITGWTDDGGAGDMVLLGDVLFIRQDSRTHRRISGLLAALRTPARRVLVDDAASHAGTRAALAKPVTVAFKSKPLGAAIDELTKNVGVDMRLDLLELRGMKINERTPITFELRDQSLQTTLDLMLANYQLSWILRDGVLWITTDDVAQGFLKTAVFDVRDLCPDSKSSELLKDAIERQADTPGWQDDGGPGQIEFAKPGIMVMQQTERGLDSVQELLENYRFALRNSKRRISAEEDPEAIVVKYYRMPTEVAEDLEKSLPTLLQPDSWKTEKQPAAVGTIRRLRSWSQPVAGEGETNKTPTAAYSILVIEQKRKVHAEIPDLLHKIQHGDAQPAFGGGMGGMGGMGGGFF
ncbi:MAG: hypothetical protein U0939_25660 [Pirellulales bacterium]